MTKLPRRRYQNVKVVIDREKHGVQMTLSPGADRTVKIRDAFGTITIAFDLSFEGPLRLTTEGCANPSAHLSLRDRLAEVASVATARAAAWADRRHVSWPESIGHHR